MNKEPSLKQKLEQVELFQQKLGIQVESLKKEIYSQSLQQKIIDQIKEMQTVVKVILNEQKALDQRIADLQKKNQIRTQRMSPYVFKTARNTGDLKQRDSQRQTPKFAKIQDSPSFSQQSEKYHSPIKDLREEEKHIFVSRYESPNPRGLLSGHTRRL